MSDLAIALHWHRASPVLQTGSYSNEHTLQYNNRYDLTVDSAPDWSGNPDNTNPEQALASALSSCHMVATHVLPDWHLPEGGIFVVLPASKFRAAKVSVFTEMLRRAEKSRGSG